MFFRDMKHGMMDVGIFCKESRFGIGTEKDCSITKFLNRILGLEVHKQNFLFQYFTENFDYLIEKDKKEGKYDMGILDLAPGNDEIYEERQETFLTAGNPQDGQVVLYKISVDRGMTWDEAYNKALNLSGNNEGFYLSQKLRGNNPCVLLAEQGRGKNIIVYKPNIGKQTHPESLDKLQQRYRKVTVEEARESWENQFNFSFSKCSHANWNGKCKKIEEGQECLQGMRLRQYHMLCGALLRVWKRVSDVVSEITGSSILQIVRLKTKQHNKQVGIKIPENCVARVRGELIRMDEEVKRRRKEREKQALEQRLAEERMRKMEQVNKHLLANLFSQKPILNQSLAQSLAQSQILKQKPSENSLQRTLTLAQLQRMQAARAQNNSQIHTPNRTLAPGQRTQQRTQNNWSTNNAGPLPSVASLSSSLSQFYPQSFPSSLARPKTQTLPLLPTKPSPSVSSKNPFEDILDLTMSSPSPSPDSTEGGLGLEGLTAHSSGYRDDFGLESLISQSAPHTQPPLLLPPPPQQNHNVLSGNNQDLLDFLDLPLSPQMPTQKSSPPASLSASSSSSSTPSVSHVSTGLLSTSTLISTSSSASSPLFPGPPSSSSLFSNPSPDFLSNYLLAQPDSLSAPNGHCSSDTLDVREALNSMLQAGPDRKSVIHYRQQE